MDNVFSQNEEKILKVLGKEKMTVKEIACHFYDNPGDTDQRNYIAGVIRRIVRKCERYHMAWTLKGEGSGRHGRTIWRAKKGT